MEHKTKSEALAELLIKKLQEKLNLFPDEDDPALYERGLYDGYLNALGIIVHESAKFLKDDNTSFEFDDDQIDLSIQEKARIYGLRNWPNVAHLKPFHFANKSCSEISAHDFLEGYSYAKSENK